MRSDQIKRGIERAPQRALRKATGLTDAAMGKPFGTQVSGCRRSRRGHKYQLPVARSASREAK
jgi:hypothetical protein